MTRHRSFALQSSSVVFCMKNEVSSMAPISTSIANGSEPANLTSFRVFTLVICFAAMQMLPAVLNKYPFVFLDTVGYHKAGAAVIETLAGKSAEDLITEKVGVQSQYVTGQSEEERIETLPEGDFSVPMSRSPYYGVFVYLSFTFEVYFLAFLQCLVAGYAVWLVARQLCPDYPVKPYLVTGAVCALVTPLPYFATYTMPDFFAALAPVCLFLLCYSGNSLTRLQQLFCWVTLAATAAFHNSHIVLIFGLLGVLAVMSVWPRLRPTMSGWLVSCSALGAGVFAVFLFGFVAQTIFGSWPQSFPFLTARGIEDGPVAELIENDCETHGFTICGAAPLESRDSQHFLWHPSGFYQSSDRATRLKLSDEDATVFLTAALQHPGMQIAASLKNTAEQFVMFGLYEFQTSQRVFVEQAPVFMSDANSERYGNSLAVTGTYPFVPLSTLIYVAAVFSLLTVIYIYATHPVSNVALSIGILILMTLVGNAVICGVLSDPHHRYQARIIWLLPLLASFLVFHIAQKRAAPNI